MIRTLPAFVCAFLCATSVVADVIQPDSTSCDDPGSVDVNCHYTPAILWPSFWTTSGPSSSQARENRAFFTPDAGTPVFDFKGARVGTLTAEIISGSLYPGDHMSPIDERHGFDLVYNVTAGGATDRIDQPLEFAFAMGSETFPVWRSPFDLPGSDSVPLLLYPRLPWARARALPEQTTWSELLTLSLGSALLAGLVAIRKRP
jgi:hypothetical protein